MLMEEQVTVRLSFDGKQGVHTHTHKHTHLDQPERNYKRITAGSVPLRYTGERVCASAYGTRGRGMPPKPECVEPSAKIGVGLTVVVALVVARAVGELPPFTFRRSRHAAMHVSDHDRWSGCDCTLRDTYTNAPTGGSQLHWPVITVRNTMES